MESSGDKKKRTRRPLLRIGLAVLTLGLLIFGIYVVRRPTAIQLAEQAIARGDFAAAETTLINRLKRFPDATDARYKLAVLLKKTDADAALSFFRQIPPDAAEYLLAVRHIAQICLLSKRDEEAERALHILEQADPADHAVQLSLAELYFHQEEYAKALPYAKRCADRQPRRANTFLLIAEIRDGLNQTAEMVSPLKRAISLDPNLYPAHLNLAYALLSSGEFDRARAEARWCLERNPNDFYPHRILAAAARDQGRMDVAQRELRTALELKPDDLDCRLLEADLLMYNRHSQKAYQRLKPLYLQYRDKARYLGRLARAAAATGRVDEASKLQQEIARFYSKPPG